MRTLLTIIIPLAAPWDFSRHDIPLNEIRTGGPPRDGIPALDQPRIPACLSGGLHARE